MKNKDIHEWLLDQGIDPLTTVTTEKGEYYLSDVLEKHLTEQLRLFAVVGRSEQLKAFMHFVEFAKQEYGLHIPLNLIKEYVKSL
jgi:hypothetical protein